MIELSTVQVSLLIVGLFLDSIGSSAVHRNHYQTGFWLQTIAPLILLPGLAIGAYSIYGRTENHIPIWGYFIIALLLILVTYMMVARSYYYLKKARDHTAHQTLIK